MRLISNNVYKCCLNGSNGGIDDNGEMNILYNNNMIVTCERG